VTGRAGRACGLLGLLLLVGLLGTGCASTRSATERADDRSRVVGVWEYRTRGTSVLQEGTLRIGVEDGRLVGRLRDSWQGTVEARVTLYGSRMEIDLNRIRITGRIRQGRFEAAIRREFESVSVRPRSQRRPAYFVARRVRSAAATDHRARYGCPSLLRERSYQCSPFQRPRP
jgi:hypothetical protein